MSENLKFQIIENGRVLRVTAENPAEFLQYIEDHKDDALTSYKPNSDMALMQLTESYSGNGWGIFTADQLGQLSECLVIAEESTSEDDGSFTLNGRVWTNIHNYMIVNPLDQIAENGYCDFYLWEEMKGENFKDVWY